MKIDSIMPLIGLFDPDLKFQNGEDRFLKLFKRTMWVSLALYTTEGIGYTLFPNQSRRFFKYLDIVFDIATDLMIPSLFLTLTEAARVRFNHNKNF
ncbi:MAG: hypothetical protein FJZ61_04110 [Chlamydiae bacterium]|nr:hypothetical protein [Chlamydiota bacterium]